MIRLWGRRSVNFRQGLMGKSRRNCLWSWSQLIFHDLENRSIGNWISIEKCRRETTISLGRWTQMILWQKQKRRVLYLRVWRLMRWVIRLDRLSIRQSSIRFSDKHQEFTTTTKSKTLNSKITYLFPPSTNHASSTTNSTYLTTETPMFSKPEPSLQTTETISWTKGRKSSFQMSQADRSPDKIFLKAPGKKVEKILCLRSNSRRSKEEFLWTNWRAWTRLRIRISGMRQNEANRMSLIIWSIWWWETPKPMCQRVKICKSQIRKSWVWKSFWMYFHLRGE